MDFIIGALTEYWHAFRDASRGFFQQRAVAGVLFLYFAIMGIASTFLEGFGMAGSLIMCGIRCGCISSYLYLLREIIDHRSSRIGMREYQHSFTAYLHPVMGVVFALFVANMVLGWGTSNSPQQDMVFLAFEIATCVALNVVAEVIYVPQRAETETFPIFSASIEFIRENWPEWFVATLFWFALITFALVLPMPGPKVLAFLAMAKELHAPGPFEAVQSLVPILLLNVLRSLEFDPWMGLLANVMALLGFHFMMIFRGFLFRSLSQGSRRTRRWSRRMRR